MLLTGIHLMRSGEVQADLPTLAGQIESPAYLPDLIAVKAEREHGAADVPHARVKEDVERLHTLLDEAQEASALPDAPSGYDALHAFVVRARLDGVGEDRNGGQGGRDGVREGLGTTVGVLER